MSVTHKLVLSSCNPGNINNIPGACCLCAGINHIRTKHSCSVCNPTHIHFTGYTTTIFMTITSASTTTATTTIATQLFLKYIIYVCLWVHIFVKVGPLKPAV